MIIEWLCHGKWGNQQPGVVAELETGLLPKELLAMRGALHSFHCDLVAKHRSAYPGCPDLELGHTTYLLWKEGLDEVLGFSVAKLAKDFAGADMMPGLEGQAILFGAVRYRMLDTEDWIHLDGVDRAGDPVKGPRPRKTVSPGAKAAKKEREANERLRESGLIS